MIVGYILIGIMAGLVAFVAALVAGATIWSALALYSLVGSVAVVMVPLVQLALGALRSDSEASLEEDVSDAEEKVVTPSSWAHASEDVELVRGDSFAPPTEEAAQSALPLKILAVDDDPFILELISMIAATAGYHDVTSIADGKLALEALTNKAIDFDCLLFDINIPEIDGIELCALARQIPAYRNTPIIMLTAMRDLKYMDRAFQAGATDYATKPFDITDLTDRLEFAEESITAQQRSAAIVEVPDDSADIPQHHPFALSGSVVIEGVDCLIEQAAVSNYVAQLSREQVGNIHVVAIKVDHIENIYAITTTEMFERILREVARVIQGVLDSRVMTYAGSGVFLSISDTTGLDPWLMEEGVRSGLTGMTFTNRDNDLFQITVSIGQPVVPIERKIKRSEITFDRAIIRAENRFYQKQKELMSGSG